MKLLVVVLCLLSERFLIHSASYQRFSWFGQYSQQIMNYIDKNNYFTNSWLILASIVAPVILITAFFYLLFHNVFFGFLGLILSIVIFFYCLGPQNSFYPLSADMPNKQNDDLIANYFASVNSQLFTVLFWYLILGPIAALTYRLIALCREVSSISSNANQVADILEWIPARLTVLLFLLVGNFQRGFNSFLNFLLAGPESNNKMLGECGLQAVRSSDSEEVPIPVAENLVEQATIVLLVLVALFTLVAWM